MLWGLMISPALLPGAHCVQRLVVAVRFGPLVSLLLIYIYIYTTYTYMYILYVL
jgi:hypothetical protein